MQTNVCRASCGAKIKKKFSLRENKKGNRNPVAIYHLSVKTIGRSEGRSATAAAAYRSADKITDKRTGEIHDYTRKSGVEYTEIVLPNNAPDWATDRAALWNAAEKSETRKNSTVAREFEIALPSELSEKERQKLAVTFAKEIVERHGVAADIAIHEPSRGGDNRNHHAHILITTRQLSEDGFTKKTRELDDRKSGEVERWRERFAELQNESFKKNGINETVDHRTLKAQGIDREPTKHLGVAATNYERRTGEPSRKRYDFEKNTAARLKLAKETGELEREAKQLEHSILIISSDLKQAKKAKADAYNHEELKATVKAEHTDIMSNFQKERAERAALERDQAAKKPNKRDIDRG
jgi:ATP-dependent exoDNAse (exonuclease V) alpha subunit